MPQGWALWQLSLPVIHWTDRQLTPPPGFSFWRICNWETQVRFLVELQIRCQNSSCWGRWSSAAPHPSCALFTLSHVIRSILVIGVPYFFFLLLGLTGLSFCYLQPKSLNEYTTKKPHLFVESSICNTRTNRILNHSCPSRHDHWSEVLNDRQHRLCPPLLGTGNLCPPLLGTGNLCPKAYGTSNTLSFWVVQCWPPQNHYVKWSPFGWCDRDLWGGIV